MDVRFNKYDDAISEMQKQKALLEVKVSSQVAGATAHGQHGASSPMSDGLPTQASKKAKFAEPPAQPVFTTAYRRGSSLPAAGSRASGSGHAGGGGGEFVPGRLWFKGFKRNLLKSVMLKFS